MLPVPAEEKKAIPIEQLDVRLRFTDTGEVREARLEPVESPPADAAAEPVDPTPSSGQSDGSLSMLGKTHDEYHAMTAEERQAALEAVERQNWNHQREELIRGYVESDLPLIDAAKQSWRNFGATDEDIDGALAEAQRRHDAATAEFNQRIQSNRQKIEASAPTVNVTAQAAGAGDRGYISVHWTDNPERQLIEYYSCLYRHASNRGAPNGGWTQMVDEESQDVGRGDYNVIVAGSDIKRGETYDVTVEAGCKFGSVQAAPVTITIPVE